MTKPYKPLCFYDQMQSYTYFLLLLFFFFFFFILSLHSFFIPSLSSPSPAHHHQRHLLQNGTVSTTTTTTCPLEFNVIRTLVRSSRRHSPDITSQCWYILQSLRLVLSDYLRRTQSFLPPLNSSDSCWDTYQALVNEFDPNFDVRRTCGFQTSWISQGCMNITTRAEFESHVSVSSLSDVVSACDQSLMNSSPCATCTTRLSSLQASYLNGPSVGNVSDCTAYSLIYAAAFANNLGPTDEGTAMCLFALDFTSPNRNNRQKNMVILVVFLVVEVILFLGFSGFWYFWRKKRMLRRKKSVLISRSKLSSGLDSISGRTTLIKFTFDEIKEATRNFSRDNLIGRGEYGNVYKGVLPDGSEVALKRFKNCSEAGDATFMHEVEVIASIRHVNLVALRGYCTATTPFEGHQRIIVCDFMKNGSVYDHLFGMEDEWKLSWPIRQKIALGTARGLAYLHYGAQTAIMHRDIKSSNILLDKRFEPKVADFGLARFTPEGMTHLSTRVAGTMGYIAPEYALYGRLTERTDVYSFGVVLLELLSGRKALVLGNEGQPALLADWAWALVRQGRALDVIEDGMPDLGHPAVMEKYVLLAVICSHPELYARPTMDQVVKILETDIPVPSIPERSIPLIADIEDIKRSVSSSGSCNLSTSAGYQLYMFEKDPLSHFQG